MRADLQSSWFHPTLVLPEDLPASAVSLDLP
jgi:hypothetical protein